MKIAIIGAGAITRRAHLPSLLKMPQVEVASLVDLDLTLAGEVAKEFGLKAVEKDYSKVLKDRSIDLVVVNTSTPAHHKICMDILDSGKHVVVEKPMVMDLNEAITLYKKVKSTGQSLCVVQNYRFLDAPVKAKKRIEGGFIGDITSVHADSLSMFPVGWTENRWLYHKYAVLYDFTPHVIDMTLWCAGSKLKSVYAQGRDWSGHTGFLTFAQILIEFESGACATIDSSWLSGTLRFFMDIRGTAGYIQFNPFKNYFSEVHGSVTPIQEFREFRGKMANFAAKALGKAKDPNSVYAALYSDLFEALKNRTKVPVDVAEGIRVNIVLDAAKESIQNGKPVEIRSFLKTRQLEDKLIEEIL